MQIYKRLTLSILLGVVILTTTGCSTKTPRYYPSSINAEKIRQLDKDIKIISSSESIDDSSIYARMKAVTTPRGESFSEYIINAFNFEMRTSSKQTVAKDASVLTLQLQDISISTFAAAYWEFKVKITAQNNKSMLVNYRYDYQGSANGNYAVSLAARTFKPAVQGLIGYILYSPEFDSLLKN